MKNYYFCKIKFTRLFQTGAGRKLAPHEKELFKEGKNFV